MTAFNYIIIYFLIFLSGIISGGFMNLCISRILNQEKISKWSYCSYCGYQLRWFELIPLISYLMLKGDCRKCGKKISIQYPIVEMVNGLLYVFIFTVRNIHVGSALIMQYNIITVLYCFAASAFLVLSIIDFRIYEIPVCINYFLMVIGFVHIMLDSRNWSNYLIGFFTVSVFLYIIYFATKGNAIGGGDIKLMAAGGLLLGWKNIWLAFLLGCILGSVFHLLRMKITNTGRVLALGPYLSMGMFIAILFGDTIWNWYLGVFFH